MTSTKIIWITGASSGIGKACAKYYASKGVRVILSGRNEDRLHAVASSLAGGGHEVLPFDMEDFNDIQRAVKVLTQSKKIIPDTILLNAGLSQRSLAIDTDIEVTKRLMRVNFFANVELTRLMLSHLKSVAGRIGVITSVTGKIGTPYRSSYAASKHALHGFFDSLRAEEYKSGLSITLICPGYIKTNVSINALTADGTSQNTMDDKTAKGMKAEVLAKKIYKSLEKRKSEVYIGGSEILAIYLKRYIPSVLERLLTKVKVK